jgi:hypothetical protein
MKEKILSLLLSDAAVQEQYLNTLRRSEFLEPEKALLLAVLQDAIASYQKYCSARDRVGKERFSEAEHWIMHKGDDWIFTFDNVCELLGLDPQYVREGIREWGARSRTQEKPRRRQGLRRQAA